MISFIAPTIRRLENASSDLAVLYCFEEMRPFQGITSLVDWRLHGHLSRMVIEGFFTGKLGVPLLVPLERQLPQQYLLLLGIGRRGTFDETVCREALCRTFEIGRGLKITKIAMSLPGRVENVSNASDAIGWFIESYDAVGNSIEGITLMESLEGQKEMTPYVERWRLRRMIPGFGVSLG
jgi:hypothetical protein